MEHIIYKIVICLILFSPLFGAEARVLNHQTYIYNNPATPNTTLRPSIGSELHGSKGERTDFSVEEVSTTIGIDGKTTPLSLSMTSGSLPTALQENPSIRKEGKPFYEDDAEEMNVAADIATKNEGLLLAHRDGSSYSKLKSRKTRQTELIDLECDNCNDEMSNTNSSESGNDTDNGTEDSNNDGVSTGADTIEPIVPHFALPDISKLIESIYDYGNNFYYGLFGSLAKALRVRLKQFMYGY